MSSLLSVKGLWPGNWYGLSRMSLRGFMAFVSRPLGGVLFPRALNVANDALDCRQPLHYVVRDGDAKSLFQLHEELDNVQRVGAQFRKRRLQPDQVDAGRPGKPSPEPTQERATTRAQRQAGGVAQLKQGPFPTDRAARQLFRGEGRRTHRQNPHTVPVSEAVSRSPLLFVLFPS